MRSIWLNYEVSLFVYDDVFAAELQSLQQSYIVDIRPPRSSHLVGAPLRPRFLENAFRLASPLL